MSVKRKANLNFKVKFQKERKSLALELPERKDPNKIYFSAKLVHALPRDFPEHNNNLPISNDNGEVFLADGNEAPDFIDGAVGLQERVDTVIDSSGNLFHDADLTVGHIKEAEFIDETDEEAARIDFIGVAQRNLLNRWGFSQRNLEEGEFDISMEAPYQDWYYLWGEEAVSRDDMPELEDYVGDAYENKGVIRVITDFYFDAFGFIESGFQADELANIKAVAYNKEKKGDKEDMSDKFKVFDTEKEFNEFKDNLIEESRKGYAKVEEILENFSKLDLEGEDINDVVKSVASIKCDLEETQNEYEQYKEQVENEKVFAERKEKLEAVDVKVSEDDKEEIIDLSEKAFAMLVKSNKEKMQKSKGSKKDESNFDPNLSSGNDELDVDAVKLFQ